MKQYHHHYNKQSSSSASSLADCGVSSLSLSGLSLESDGSSSQHSTSASNGPFGLAGHGGCAGSSSTSCLGRGDNGGGMKRSTLRRGFGSTACHNLSALALCEEQQAEHQSPMSTTSLAQCPSRSEGHLTSLMDETSSSHMNRHQHLQPRTSTSSPTSSIMMQPMDTTGDDWGYFVDGTLPSSVPIVW